MQIDLPIPVLILRYPFTPHGLPRILNSPVATPEAMALIIYDLTVLIAEHVGMDSMAPLMLSSKTNYQLIKGHERSIVKAKLARLAYDPMLRPPLGALLSSSAPAQPGMGSGNRRVLDPISFAVAHELELRERRINDLFNPKSTGLCGGRPLTETITRLPLFQNLPPNQMERLIEGFKDACRVADRIADCATSVHLEQQPSTSHLKDRKQERAIDHEVHLARQQYIRSLPPIRLAFLTLLASLIGAEYAQQLQSPHSDPFQWERVTAFKETFIRHGTVVISALLCPSENGFESTDAPSSVQAGNFAPCPVDSSSPSPSHSPHTRSESARYYTSQVTAVLMELLAYEGGHWGFSPPVEDEGGARPILDGLHMTMLQAFQGFEEEEEEKEEEPGEVDQPLGQIEEEEEEDADGDWLFNIDVLGDDAGDVDENPEPLPEVKPDPREALVLRWVRQS